MREIPTQTTTKVLLGAIAGMLAADVDDAVDLMTAVEVTTMDGSAELAAVLLVLAQDLLGMHPSEHAALDRRLEAVTSKLSRTALIDAVRNAAKTNVYTVTPTPRPRHLRAVH